MQNAFQNIIVGEIFNEYKVEDENEEEVVGLAEATWPYSILDDTGEHYKSLDTVDCMIICMKLVNMAEDPAVEPIVRLPDCEINLENMVVLVQAIPDKQFKLQRSEDGRAYREKDSVRSRGDQFNLVLAIDNKFSHETGAFGYKWSVIYKNR